MRTIDITFESLEEHPTASLFGAIGVYVLWDPDADHTPTYLGEGLLLSRLNRHVDWLSPEVTGIGGQKREWRTPDGVVHGEGRGALEGEPPCLNGVVGPKALSASGGATSAMARAQAEPCRAHVARARHRDPDPERRRLMLVRSKLTVPAT